MPDFVGPDFNLDQTTPAAATAAVAAGAVLQRSEADDDGNGGQGTTPTGTCADALIDMITLISSTGNLAGERWHGRDPVLQRLPDRHCPAQRPRSRSPVRRTDRIRRLIPVTLTPPQSVFGEAFEPYSRRGGFLSQSMQQKLAILGAGNMAEAIARGVIRAQTDRGIADRRKRSKRTTT